MRKKFYPNQIKMMKKKTGESNRPPEKSCNKQSNKENCQSDNEEEKEIIITDN